MAAAIRPLRRGDDAEIALVAERMRLTLVEVLGEEIGASMYSTEWLLDRVRWHLDPRACRGEVFVAEQDGAIAGHAIVRVEPAGGPAAEPIGLFSTIYVVPTARRQGVAGALLARGEEWLAAEGMTTFATNTSETNAPLIALFERRGYAIALRVPEKRMIQLSRVCRP